MSALRPKADIEADVGSGAFRQRQLNRATIHAIPLVGFTGARVLEVVVDNYGDTYRAVYTVKMRDAVYALHAFQKKSKRGRKTPLPESRLIRSRLKLAEEHYKENFEVPQRKEQIHERGA